jgi:hypothetical protein
MSQLKVVWRNSRTAEREKRWHELGCDVGRKLYVVEELVPLGDQKRWAQAVALEIVPGGPATAPRSGSASFEKKSAGRSLRYLAFMQP